MILQPWARRDLKAPSGVMLLDRDGVLVNLADRYAVVRQDIESIAGVPAAAARLAAAGFKAVVVTNQSAIGRGKVSRREALITNEWILTAIDPARAFVQCALICPHAPSYGCSCRKPATEGVLSFSATLGPLQDRWFVGDQLSDLLCAETLGMRAVLVRSGHGLETEGRAHILKRRPTVVDDFTEFADLLLGDVLPRRA